MFKFIGNDTIAIAAISAGLILSIVLSQESVTTACLGALAGFIGKAAIDATK